MSPGEREEKGAESRNRQSEPRYFFQNQRSEVCPHPLVRLGICPQRQPPVATLRPSRNILGSDHAMTHPRGVCPSTAQGEGEGASQRCQPTSAGSKELLGVSKRLEAKLPAKKSRPGFYPHRRKKRKKKKKKQTKRRGHRIFQMPVSSILPS